MKRITTIAIILAMLLVSCNNTATEPEVTTAGTDVTTVGTTETTATETTAAPETTVMTTAETEVTTAVSDEPFDAEAFLAECTVYEVTVDTQDAPLVELEDLADADKPKKIALRFTDAEGLTLFIDSGETIYGNHYYFVKHIFNDRVNIFLPGDITIGYSRPDFYVTYSSGATVVRSGNASGRVLECCVIQGNDYDIICNSASSSGNTLFVYVTEDGSLEYSKMNEKYAHNDFESFLMAYESDDDFYDESGRLVFENGEISFVTDTIRTIKDGHFWIETVDEYCAKHNAETLAELVEIYKQYMAEGNTREFMKLE